MPLKSARLAQLFRAQGGSGAPVELILDSWAEVEDAVLADEAGARAALTAASDALPTLAGAAVFKGAKSGAAMIEVFGWADVLLGAAVAAVAALVAVKFLVHFLARHGLAGFAYYRLALAVALTVFYLL